MKPLIIVQLQVGEIGTNCYLIFREKKAVCIDPGDEVERIISTLKKNNVQLEAILLTHGHFDHCLAANILREKTNAKIYACKDEEGLLLDANLNLSKRFGVPFSIKADVFVEDMEKIAFDEIDIRVIYTPGHTGGGCSYYVEADAVVFSGDTLFLGSIGRTDFPSGDATKLIQSIKDKLLILPGETKVYPGHGEQTSIQREKEYNMYLK